MIHFADAHLHPYKDFSYKDPKTGVNSRLIWGAMMLRHIAKEAHRRDHIVTFSGDLLDNDDNLKNATFNVLLATYEKYFQRRGLTFIAISGNHDQSNYNVLEYPSHTYLKGMATVFSTFKLIDYTSIKVRNNHVWGIPYLSSPADTLKLLRDFKKHSKEGDSLLIHSDLPGAKTPYGIETAELDEHIDRKTWIKLTKHYKIVLAGHIHQHQRISNNTYMIGPPLQKDRGEISIKPGYMVTDNFDNPEFREIPKTFPRFILGYPVEGDDLNFYIQNLDSQNSATNLETSEDSPIDISNRVKVIKEYCEAKEYSKKQTSFLIKILTKDGEVR